MKTFKGSIYEITDPETVLERYLDTLGGRKNTYQAQKTRAILHFLQHEQFSGKRILDVGSGAGVWTAFFLEQGAVVTSCDKRRHFIEAAKRYIYRLGLDERRLTFVCSDIMDFQPEEEFDFVFAKDVIEHIEDDHLFLRKVRDVTGEEGILFISTQNALSLNYVLEGTVRRLMGNTRWKGWDPTHLRLYTPVSLRRKLLDAGFRPVRWYSMYHLPYKLLHPIIMRIGGKNRSIDYRAFHLLEKYGEHFPFNKTGWNLGTISQKMGNTDRLQTYA